MIVGFDGSRAFVPDRTGTENYSYQLLINLAKIDRENTYIVYLRPENEIPFFSSSSDPGFTEGESRSSLDQRSSPRWSNKNYGWPENFYFKVLHYPRFWTQFGLALQTFIDPIDLLFTPSHTLPLIRRPNLKTVMTVHDLGSEYLPGLHQLKQRLYLGFITKFQLKTASRLIAVSLATKKDLIDKVGVKEERIEVIYEGSPSPQPSPIKGEGDTLKWFDLEKGKYFLFVGTVQPRKNLSRLIEAFAKLVREGKKEVLDSANAALEQEKYSSSSTEVEKYLKLVIVGGKGWMSDEIYALPKRLGIETERSSLADRVKFLGRVDDKYLPELYKNALGFVYPSLFEGFGLPILEAFYYDCPVLTSNISSMPEVAGKSAILIDPYDINSISNGMRQLLDEKTRRKLIELGKEQLSKFSWEKAARETLQLFKILGL